MRVAVLAITGIVFLSIGASAQNIDIIKKRQDIYKSFGDATKPIGAILKGQAPFDLKTVKTALETYSAGAKKLPDLFPDDSKTGHDTEALPAIWEHKADFEDHLKKFEASTSAALVSITDQASFQKQFPDIAKQCGACHKLYREKKDK